MNLRDHALYRLAELNSEAGKTLSALVGDFDMSAALTDNVIAEAASDVIARKLGLPSGVDDHPAAGILRGHSLSDLGEAIARTKGRTRVDAAQTLSDLAPAIANAFQKLASITYGASSEHRRLCRDIDLPNYTKFSFPTADIAIDSADIGRNEHGEWKSVNIFSAAGLTAQVNLWGCVFGLSDEVIRNDALGVYATTIGNLGGFSSRRESNSVANIFVNNPLLADGRQLCNATDGNLLTTTPLNATNLGILLAKQRRQVTLAGNASNNATKFLIVSPEQEVTALTLALSVSVDPKTPRLEVFVAPEIPDGTWFVLADPAVSPVIGFLKVPGTQTFHITKGNLSYAYAGTGLKIEMVYGVVPLSRIGVVKAVA
jgi:hypothetical protein